MSKRTKLLSVMILVGVLVALSVQTAVAQDTGWISGLVYVDNNGNGIREEGEAGAKEVAVTFKSGDVQTTINTAEDGTYSIALNPGTWTVSIAVPSGYTASKTSTDVVLENAGDTVSNVEFPLTVSSEEGDVLPESGGVISGQTLVFILLGVMVVGAMFIMIGQRRGSQLES